MVKNLTLYFPVEVNGKTGINGREFSNTESCVYFCTGG